MELFLNNKFSHRHRYRENSGSVAVYRVLAVRQLAWSIAATLVSPSPDLPAWRLDVVRLTPLCFHRNRPVANETHELQANGEFPFRLQDAMPEGVLFVFEGKVYRSEHRRGAFTTTGPMIIRPAQDSDSEMEKVQGTVNPVPDRLGEYRR